MFEISSGLWFDSGFDPEFPVQEQREREIKLIVDYFGLKSQTTLKFLGAQSSNQQINLFQEFEQFISLALFPTCIYLVLFLDHLILNPSTSVPVN